MKTNIKSKRGFTLAELIVAAVVTVMIIGAAGTSMILGLDIFGSATSTAQQQRDIKLVETALKENILNARSYDISERDPGDIPAEADNEVSLYYDGDELVMQIGDAKITSDNIDSVTVEFLEGNDFCYAEYTISTPGIEHTGAIVMNNIVDDSGGSSCTLIPNGYTVLHMVLPPS